MELTPSPADPRVRRLLRTYAVLSGINQLIVREQDPEVVLQNACDIAVEKGGFLMAWIGLVGRGESRVRPAASAGRDDGYVDSLEIDLASAETSAGPTGAALRAKTFRVCNDIDTDPAATPWRDGARARGFRSSGAFPILVNGQVLGTFNFYASEPDFFDDEECRLLTELATDIGFALDVSRREAERAAADDRTTRQRATLIELTRAAPNADVGESLRRIAEASARTLDVGRVSIWQFTGDGSALTCVEMFELREDRHSRGMTLQASDYPTYFAALTATEVISADDAPNDPHTSEFADRYLRPLGITSMLDVPIRVGGLRAGVLCHEHVEARRVWTADEKTFAVAIASLVSLTLETAQRLAAQRAAAERAERFRELAEAVHDVFWVADPYSARVLYVSPAYDRIFGRSSKALLEDPNEWIEGIHPDDRERMLQASSDRIQFVAGEHEFRVVRPDGHVRWVRAQGFPVRDSQGGIVRLVGVARDITEHRMLEEQLRQSQKMEAIGQLAGGVAHDFNNILAAIIMQAELTASGDLSREAHEGIAQIRAAAERAANLTRQLLLFSRRQVMQPRELDVNEVVTNLARMLQRIIGEDIRLQLHLHAKPLFTRADAGMLDQVLLNLAVNARDAMPHGGRLVIETTQVQLHRDRTSHDPDAIPGSYVCLRITDTGSGMPPEVLPRIFEPFFTTKERGKGTGLGLATVFGIVKQHRGWIDVESRVGEGSVFTIYLPVRQSDVADEHDAARASNLLGGTETILLAEDDPSVRSLIRATLARHGYRVLEAASGADAVHLWSGHQDEIDLLLTDLVMPGGMSGQQLAARLHQDNPALRVVFTSGYSAEIAGRELALRPGENFVQKPFPPSQLLRVVRRALEG